MTAVLGAPRLDTRFESVTVRAVTAVALVAVIAVGSQPTTRDISPLGTLAIALFPLAQHSVAMLLLVATVASGAITGAVPVFFSLPATFLSGSAAAAGFAIACSVANIAGLLSNALVGLSLSLTGDASLALLPFAGFMLVAIAIVWSLPAKTVNR